jgi:hypothetical protein
MAIVVIVPFVVIVEVICVPSLRIVTSFKTSTIFELVFLRVIALTSIVLSSDPAEVFSNENFPNSYTV